MCVCVQCVQMHSYLHIQYVHFAFLCEVFSVSIRMAGEQKMNEMCVFIAFFTWPVPNQAQCIFVDLTVATGFLLCCVSTQHSFILSKREIF